MNHFGLLPRRLSLTDSAIINIKALLPSRAIRSSSGHKFRNKALLSTTYCRASRTLCASVSLNNVIHCPSFFSLTSSDGRLRAKLAHVSMRTDEEKNAFDACSSYSFFSTGRIVVPGGKRFNRYSPETTRDS